MKAGPPMPGPANARHGPGDAARASDSSSSSSASERGWASIVRTMRRLLLSS